MSNNLKDLTAESLTPSAFSVPTFTPGTPTPIEIGISNALLLPANLWYAQAFIPPTDGTLNNFTVFITGREGFDSFEGGVSYTVLGAIAGEPDPSTVLATFNDYRLVGEFPITDSDSLQASPITAFFTPVPVVASETYFLVFRSDDPISGFVFNAAYDTGGDSYSSSNSGGSYTLDAGVRFHIVASFTPATIIDSADQLVKTASDGYLDGEFLGTTSIDALADVDLTTPPMSGDFLSYSGSAWVAAAAPPLPDLQGAYDFGNSIVVVPPDPVSITSTDNATPALYVTNTGGGSALLVGTGLIRTANVLTGFADDLRFFGGSSSGGPGDSTSGNILFNTGSGQGTGAIASRTGDSAMAFGSSGYIQLITGNAPFSDSITGPIDIYTGTAGGDNSTTGGISISTGDITPGTHAGCVVGDLWLRVGEGNATIGRLRLTGGNRINDGVGNGGDIEIFAGSRLGGGTGNGGNVIIKGGTGDVGGDISLFARQIVRGTDAANSLTQAYFHGLTLPADTTAVLPELTYATAAFGGLEVIYRVIDTVTTDVRVGRMYVASCPTDVTISNTGFADVGDVGVEWSAAINGGNVEISYATTGAAKTLHIDVKRFRT